MKDGNIFVAAADSGLIGFIAPTDGEFTVVNADDDHPIKLSSPAPHRAANILAVFDRAGKTREAIAKEVGISVVSLYRIFRTRKDAEKEPVAPPVTRTLTRPQVSAYKRGGGNRLP